MIPAGQVMTDFCFHHRHDGSVALFKLRGSTTPILSIIPDGVFPGMWRVLMPDGSRSDLANLDRAKFAALRAAENALRKDD